MGSGFKSRGVHHREGPDQRKRLVRAFCFVRVVLSPRHVATTAHAAGEIFWGYLVHHSGEAACIERLVSMFGKSLHRVAFSIGAAPLLVPAAAIPANAAATEGMKTIESSWCVPVPEAGLTMCSTATERNLEVHTPAGRALVRTVGSSTTTTTYGDGSVETSSDAHQV
ncbi:MAG: hypothetical protein K0Q84_2635, partial [Arthrobacter sp.]|nr:hypothetical protein [Arthrobacter sp.]